ncbi:hypothetical protein CAI21_11000 [Alkalilimnicola ehrlichii]|nr:hypothetical protein CAI21_11000 [Alkalilimnicola ehrlichii]
MAEARELWLVGSSQPRACDPVFAELYQRNELSADEIWQRIELAMNAGNQNLARYLGRHLNSSDRRWLEHWFEVSNRPYAALRYPPFDATHERAGPLLAHAVETIARRDINGAWARIPRLAEFEGVTPEKLDQVQRSVALRAAHNRREQALEWLDSLPDSAVDVEVRRWRAILARGEQNWPRLLIAINDLPPAERDRAEWRYWRGYALDHIGETALARLIYSELAQERNYYGFLAADAVNQPYNMNSEPVQYAPEDLERVAATEGLRRALELFELGMLIDARREWHAGLDAIDSEEWRYAAVLAAQVGWYDRAIITANRAGLHNALELRFPIGYRDYITRYSEQHNLELPLTFALLRKESAFMPDAVSSAGARGLMQVMPGTGRDVARRVNMRLPNNGALLDVDTNLQLGSAYLRQVLDRFGNNPVLAMAAYNAGPHHVDRWLERNAGQPAALWVENISFRETREYVKDILAFAAVFDWQINGRKPRRITDLMYSLDQRETACTFIPQNNTGGC